MELTNAIKHIIDGNAVIIMGSGASYGAKNAFGDLPSGTKLSSLLYEKSGVIPEDQYDLQDASLCYQEKFGTDRLITEIRSMLTCASFTSAHEIIYSLPWMRYYTTNYDDVALLAAAKKKVITPVTLSDDYKTNHSKDNLCIHINGHIGRLNESTLNHEFKLTAVSYMSQDHILTSPWGALLANDLDTAKCIVIIGLSLKYDLDLSRIIYNADQKEKTIIIDRPMLSENAINRLSRYGTVYSIGIDSFAEQIESISSSYLPEDKKPEDRLYTAFTYEYRRRKNIVAPTPDDVYRLFLYGDYSDSLFFKENYKYVGFVHRKQFLQAKQAVLSDNYRFIFIESDMGNGKTACLHELRYNLANEDLHIFTLVNAESSKLNEEIAAICTLSKSKNVLIIIDDYPNYMDILHKFSLQSSEQEKYLLTARSALNVNKMPVILKDFSVRIGQSNVINMNYINSQALENCVTLFDKFGFWGKRITWSRESKIKHLTHHERGARHFQSIMLDVIKSGVIKTKIDSLIKVIKEDSSQHHTAIVLILLVNVMNLRLSISDVERIIGIEAFADPVFRNSPAIKELITFNDKGKPNIKSPVTARYILQNTSNPESIIEALYNVANYAQRFSDVEKFSNVLTSIISYSHINSFMRGFNNHEQFLTAYFDKLSSIDYYRCNNFFWLQYAIACIETKRFDRAERYLDVAYGLIPAGFVPFQINNQNARFHFEKILNGQSSDPVQDMVKAHELLMIPIASEKDNELNVVELFSYYYKRKIQSVMLKSNSSLYKDMCKSAYDRLQKFLSNHPEYSDKLNSIQVSLLEVYCS